MYSAVLLTAALGAPLVVPTGARAAEPHEGSRIVVRVYDPYRRDYHAWDRDEERAYRSYLAERHRSYLTYQRQRLAERRAYWRWRHERDERLEHSRR
jgi:hypothetical protein